MKKLLLVLIGLNLFYSTWAQLNLKTEQIRLSVRYHNGFVLPHHSIVEYYTQKRINGIEINVGAISPSKWSELYNYPEYGLGYLHQNLGNNEILGKSDAIFPYIDFPLFKNNAINIYSHIGMGIAIVSKRYHPTENYKNVIISSKANAFILLAINSDVELKKNFKITAGASLNHISNGAMKKPNKGLNIACYNIGLKYDFNSKKHFKKQENQTVKKQKEINLIISSGYNQASLRDKHKYMFVSVNAEYAKRINKKHQIAYGIDLFYNKSINRGNWNLKPKTSFADQFHQGIHFSHKLIISDFALVSDIGVYTFYKTEPETPIYFRIGMQQRIAKHFILNVTLKSHMGKADFIEWGIGYSIGLKNKH